jgi:sec-independent protein translocase protein TatA
MGTVGVQEMVVIFIVALVLFGPKKLPELGKTIGKALTEFRRASNDLKATFENEMHSLERENESLKEVTSKVASDIQNYSYGEVSYYDSGAYGSGSQDSTATHTSTVSASEVPGAEQKGITEVASHAPAVEAATPIEGTVPRTEIHAPAEAPQHS